MSYHHRAWRRSGAPSNAPGAYGEMQRACDAYEARRKAELDAQVTRPAEIPCAACRRPTPIPELRGRPGRLVCAACEAPEPEPGPQPEPEPESCAEEAPQPEEKMSESNGDADVPIRHKVTEEVRQQRRADVLRLRNEGLTMHEIGQRLGIPTATVGSDLQRLEAKGITPERVTIKREAAAKLRKEIHAMLRAGATYGEICAALDTSPATVARVVKELRDRGTDPRGSDAAELAALRAELEEARQEIERLRAQLDANPWRRAYEALKAHYEAQAAREQAKTKALEAALEMAAAEAALREVGR